MAYTVVETKANFTVRLFFVVTTTDLVPATAGFVNVSDERHKGPITQTVKASINAGAAAAFSHWCMCSSDRGADTGWLALPYR